MFDYLILMEDGHPETVVLFDVCVDYTQYKDVLDAQSDRWQNEHL